jgi:hypothetical protein
MEKMAVWRSIGATVIGWLWLSAISGCCAHRADCQSEQRTCAVPLLADTIAPVPSPSEITTNWASFPSPEQIVAVARGESTVTGYRPLTEEQCQSQAVTNAVLANMLAVECQHIRSTRIDRQGCLAPADALLADLLAFRAVEERNKAAAAALELFYRLAEAQLQRDALSRSLQEIDNAITNYRQLRQRGLVLPTDDSALQRQRLDLLARQSQLNTSSRDADGQLCRLLAVPYHPLTPLSPVADLSFSSVPVDVEAAVALGLTMRPDLNMLRTLCVHINADTLPAARSAMQSMGGLLGAVSSGSQRKLCKLGDDMDLACEAQMRQWQVGMALGDQTRAAEEEIREASWEIESRLSQAVVAKGKWANLQQHLQGLHEKQKVAQATLFDVSAAQLQTLQAESDAVSALVAWKIAQVKLKKAQGALAQ